MNYFTTEITYTAHFHEKQIKREYLHKEKLICKSLANDKTINNYWRKK